MVNVDHDVECEHCGASFSTQVDISDYYDKIPDSDILELVNDNNLGEIIMYEEIEMLSKLKIIKKILGLQYWENKESVLRELEFLF